MVKNSGWVEVSWMWMRSDLGGSDLTGRNIAPLLGRGRGCSWHEHDREQCQEAGRAGSQGWQLQSRKSDSTVITKRGWETLPWCCLRGRRSKAGLGDVRKDIRRRELQRWMPALAGIRPPWQALWPWIDLNFAPPDSSVYPSHLLRVMRSYWESISRTLIVVVGQNILFLWGKKRQSSERKGWGLCSVVCPV